MFAEYNDMKSELTEYLREFVAQGKVGKVVLSRYVLPLLVFLTRVDVKFEIKHGVSLHTETEEFSLSIRNPNDRPMGAFDGFTEQARNHQGVLQTLSQ